ncbi:restriction endonuclease subunit R [Nostocoides sp. HKS02]|uniref:restriction endonuclease subunit R n=1 Tax=Nostocoides sp. HKS02 TaxID=1813880 RepID=UPI0012B4F7DB|nr:restriction endonuclease subunit R [Tetrasphaera sp. HKS02]QGN57711.1 restriction endonuclease subunit R [Tetrasphaera sp. HKS02]
MARQVCPVLEIEAGQCFRSFPSMHPDEVDQMRQAVEAEGARVSIVGLGLDDWVTPTQRRTERERAAFVSPQLRAAKQLGAVGVRLPFGQPDRSLLRELLPLLHELDLVLYQEIQGTQGPGTGGYEQAMEALEDFSDQRLSIVLDSSMVTPQLPISYLEAVSQAGLPAGLLERVTTEWGSPETTAAIRSCLAEGQVPPNAMALYMTMIFRFGTWTVADLEPLLAHVGAVQFKFWDLDDSDGRVTRPIADLGAALDRGGFAGTLCSEWGGHDWWKGPEGATEMTLNHLDLVASVLDLPRAEQATRLGKERA